MRRLWHVIKANYSGSLWDAYPQRCWTQSRETRTHTCTLPQHIMLMSVCCDVSTRIYIYKNELSLPFHNFLSRRSPPNAFNFIFYLFRACSCFGLRRRARFLKPTIWSRGCQNYFIIKHPYPARSNLHNYYFTDFHARENELWKKFMGLCTFSKEKLISFVLKQANRAGSILTMI